jgi:O-antigen ligase
MLLVALLVYFSSSVWWSAEYSARGAFSVYSRCLLILTFVVALSVSLRRFPDGMQWLARSLAVGAGVAAIAALVDLSLYPTWDGRLAGVGQLRNSVIAGLAFDAGLIFALSVLLAGGLAWRVIGAVCVLSTGAAIYATGSRGAYLGGAMGAWTLAALTWHGGRGPRLLWWFSAPVLALAAVLTLLAASPGWTDALFPRGDSFRLEIWSAEWQRLIAQGPWLGLGVLVRDDVVLQGQAFAHPHSLYLASALQGGLLGLLLLLAVLLSAGLGLYRARRWPEARLGLALLAAGTSAYLFDGWELIDKVSISWLLLWVSVAIAIGVTSKMKNARGMLGIDPADRLRDSSGERP